MSGHRCPAPDCYEQVPSAMYACNRHWFSIPKPLRDELWRAYRRHGQLSKEHIAAMEACDNFLEQDEPCRWCGSGAHGSHECPACPEYDEEASHGW